MLGALDSLPPLVLCAVILVLVHLLGAVFFLFWPVFLRWAYLLHGILVCPARLSVGVHHLQLHKSGSPDLSLSTNERCISYSSIGATHNSG